MLSKPPVRMRPQPWTCWTRRQCWRSVPAVLACARRSRPAPGGPGPRPAVQACAQRSRPSGPGPAVPAVPAQRSRRSRPSGPGPAPGGCGPKGSNLSFAFCHFSSVLPGFGTSSSLMPIPRTNNINFWKSKFARNLQVAKGLFWVSIRPLNLQE